MREPVAVRAVGVAHNDPLRGPVALASIASLVRAPADVDSIGIATVVDGAALLSHQRVDDGVTLADAFGAPKGRTAIMRLGTSGELRPTGQDHAASVGPYRARTYACAVAGGPQAPDVAASSRERLLADLPDALRRCIVGKSEGEAFFLAVLTRLHNKGLLDRPHDRTHDGGKFLLDAIEETHAQTAQAPRQVTLTNGVDLVHFAAGAPAAVVVIRGLSDELASAYSPALADSSTARERNRRYAGAIVMALEAPLAAHTPVAAGCTLHVHPDGGSILIGKEFAPH